MVTEFSLIRIVSPVGFDPGRAQASGSVRLTPTQFQRTPVREQLAVTQQYPETAEVDCCHRLGYSVHKLIVNPISGYFKVFQGHFRRTQPSQRLEKSLDDVSGVVVLSLFPTAGRSHGSAPFARIRAAVPCPIRPREAKPSRVRSATSGSSDWHCAVDLFSS
jgi:hypothetical protein